jgi:hypothetical protein
VFEPLVLDAHQLAKRIKSWHAQERGPLSLAHCQRIVAALYGHASWASLQGAARTQPEPDRGGPIEAAWFKQFGYTAEAAEKLIAYLRA